MNFASMHRLTLFGSLIAAAVSATSATASATSLAGIAPADRGMASDVARTSGVHDFGRIGARTPVTVGLLMRVRNQAELEALILAQGDRRSRYYHHYLTPAQYNTYFAPTVATYERAQHVLAERGFRITQTMGNRAMIRATAPAGTVERYFNTEIHSVFQEGHGVKYMNVRPAVMPAELRRDVVSVSGLHTIVTVHFFHTAADIAAIRRSPGWLASVAYAKAHERESRAVREPRSQPGPRPQATSMQPITGATPSAAGPDPVETPGDYTEDYAEYYGYPPQMYAVGYHYPVAHGYGGRGFAAGSVISADYLDSDAATEYSSWGIQRTGTTSKLGYRVCADPAATAKCDGLIGAGDSEGESTLDALTILSLAPNADFYEYLEANLNDIGIEFAYEKAINDNVVSALNSSFGGCETSDPTFEYSTNYIAMEGSVLGITFSASSGDNGAYSCGIYATNGAPQTEKNIFVPAADNYFVAVGGTSYLLVPPDSTTDFTGQNSWVFGGGGYSQYEPIPSWQVQLANAASPVAMVSTTCRNIPDVSFNADPGTNPDGFVGGVDGISELIVHNGTITPGGGTSLASPMYIAMQTEIDEVQGSRNGFVTPSLYAIANSSSTEYSAAFSDVVLGDNVAYPAAAGFDDASGIGTPLGWELAGAPEYGIPATGVTAARTR